LLPLYIAACRYTSTLRRVSVALRVPLLLQNSAAIAKAPLQARYNPLRTRYIALHATVVDGSG
jgi:hypothetical protein